MVIESPGVTSTAMLLLADCTPLVTWTVTLEVPAVVGVPESTPLAASVIPVGRVPAVMLHAYPPAPPLALSVSA